MLRRLLIRDFVLVDALELEFGPGFGALTGETGAGKSILVDALALLLGERADAAVVRAGCARADLSAEFEPPPQAAQWLAANDFPAEDGLLLRRVIDAGGRSRAYICGAPATAAQLRDLGELLADIHGQHAHHALLRADAQRALFDAHAGATALAQDVADSYRAWQRLVQARLEAEANAAALAREREALEWQVNELRQLAVTGEEIAALEDEQRRLAHAATLLDGASGALAALDEAEPALVEQLAQLSLRLSGLAEFDARLKPAAELLDAAAVQGGEAVHMLRGYVDRLDLDPQRLGDVDARLGAIHQLARKYRVSPEELPALAAQLEARLGELGELADPHAAARMERVAQDRYMDAARKLSEVRKKAAPKLSREVSEAIARLALGGARFEVALEPLAQLAACGLEGVEFLIAANPGEPPRALAKVASGGELSRIGLAIQVITSQAGQVPTLVFDEVDVGIGGRVAEIVGNMLKALGRERQVLCVTHLPQVAARADWQWSVAKTSGAAGTVSRVSALDAGARIEEIARMLGGVNITETTRRHAAEMLGIGS